MYPKILIRTTCPYKRLFTIHCYEKEEDEEEEEEGREGERELSRKMFLH